MNWTLIRFIATCALGVLVILALPFGPRLTRASAANARALRPFRVWMTAFILSIALSVALSDASDLGWLRMDPDILSWIQYVILLASGAAIFVALWHLPNWRSASAHGNERPSEQ